MAAVLPAHIFRVIIGHVSQCGISDLMRLALVSKRVRTLVVMFLAEPDTSDGVVSDPRKFGPTAACHRPSRPSRPSRPLGLLLPDGPLSMLGSRMSSRLSRSGATVGPVAEPKEWSLVRVGSIALAPSGEKDMKKRLALLARIVPNLHDVHVMMPNKIKSRKGAAVVDVELMFPATVRRASIGTDHPTCICNVNVSGSSVIGGEGIEQLMILAPSVILTSVGSLVVPTARSLLMSCITRSFSGIGRLTSLTSLVARIGGAYVDCELSALKCIGELHGLCHLGIVISSAWPVAKGALEHLTRLCSLEAHTTVAKVSELVQVADLSLEHVTKLCILTDKGDEMRVTVSNEAVGAVWPVGPVGTLGPVGPLGFLSSARSMAHLSLQCSKLASVDLDFLARTLTKLEITRCPKLRDVERISRLKMLVELGIYECPAVIGVLGVSDLPRLTHLSIDLSRATRAHLGDASVPLHRLLLSSHTKVDEGILSYADSIAKWLISDQGQSPKVTVAYRYGEIILGSEWESESD